ncbi:MAG TPA: type II toxin-antitoxin system VapC family toxin [Thermoanaerobaculia bacterium]|nr:type II toxin-antitoxin system VapC family toxin [Thermoanaerobaculia bacterium]
MIFYLDSSSLVKRYVAEPGAPLVERALAVAHVAATATISRVEVVAAFAKGVRFGVTTKEDAESARQLFRVEWPHFVRLRVTEAVMERACDFAWMYGLRGYDSIQLATAANWQESLDMPVAMATFDRNLWKASARAGLEPYPPDLLTARGDEQDGRLG